MTYRKCNRKRQNFQAHTYLLQTCPSRQHSPTIPCCEPEISLVTWRNRCIDDRKVEYRRPGSLDLNIRVVCCGDDCNSNTANAEKDLRPFKDANICRGACTVGTDLRRYLDRLYKHC